MFPKPYYLSKIFDLELIPKTGNVLDLGCGAGRASLFLADKGYAVTSVDKEDQKLDHSNIKFFKSSIEDFVIEKNKYGAIVARNVLSYIPDKKVIERVLEDMFNGLTDDGVMYFTVFGLKDDWVERKNVAFFADTEIDTFMEKFPINLIDKEVTEGFDSTMSGKIKFWHIYRYTYSKKSLR